MAYRRRCRNDPDVFCYICGSFITTKQSMSITYFVRKAYFGYFGMRLGDQDKTWAPHTVCRSCVENLRQWTKGIRKSLSFGIPMVWREPQNHVNDCYFCMTNISGFNAKTKSLITYPNLPSAIRPVPHSVEVPIPEFSKLYLISEIDDCELTDSLSGEDDCFIPVRSSRSKSPQLFNQFELNDLVRDLDLLKESAELLGSRLKEKNLLCPDTKFYSYRNREIDFLRYIVMEDEFVFCHDVSGLVNALGCPYLQDEWRLFIDSSKQSLKCVLLHNGNKFSSIPIGHSVHLKESYENMKFVLQKINYNLHNWVICGDLKIICILLGQQSDYTKFPCFLCLWDSRAKSEHYSKQSWPARTKLSVGEKNIIHDPLVDPLKILLPPLHIKLGLMKQFVRALDKDGNCFKYIAERFSHLSNEMKIAGIFDGPQIRQLVRDGNFSNSMSSIEKCAWIAFVDVIKNFLGNTKSRNLIIK